jgi:hypothetical protein
MESAVGEDAFCSTAMVGGQVESARATDGVTSTQNVSDKINRVMNL